ncbi:MAG TPA: uroporphyrinogen decarboxylase family protein [Armatimonadota bacterium]
MPQDDYWKAMTFQHPEYIPVGVGLLPATWVKYREGLDELVARHPIIFGERHEHQESYEAMIGGTYQEGHHVDEWGCVWHNVAAGMEAIVKEHAAPTRESVHQLKEPVPTPGFPHGFMYLRLQDLRGFEEIMADFAQEPPELRMLIDLVLGHNLRKLELTLQGRTPPGILYFGDDLGMQTSLPMSPAKWRKYLKPCYAALYGRSHEAGFHVYMHTDGHIVEIIPDLIECGVNIVNPQIRANGLDNLVEVCKGKVCVDLDLDRQLFPFCGPDEIDAHIREAVEKLGMPEGGLFLKAECGPDVSLENIEAICTALETYRGWFKG